MSTNAYFKIGDTFSVPARFYDTTTKQGIPILPSTTISARIANKLGAVIADCVVTPYPDQNLDAGYFLVEVSDTSSWPSGEALFDIKFEDGGAIKHSITECFRIIKSITP